MNAWTPKTKLSVKIFPAINYLLMSIFALSIILPFLNIFALAFNEGSDAMRGGIYFWPRMPTFENITYIFKNGQLSQAYFITISKTLLGTIASVIMTAMAAFALKSRTLPGKKLLLGVIFFTTLFSGGIIPYYILLHGLGLTKSFLIYILPALYSVYNLIILRTFFNSISISLEEAAKIDGASDFQIFFRVILPMSKPVIAVIALFNGVFQWNDWFTGTFFVRADALLPVATLLQKMLTDTSAIVKLLQTSSQAAMAMQKMEITTTSVQMAMILVCTVPIMCVYPFVQKYFVTGIMIGSLKE